MTTSDRSTTVLTQGLPERRFLPELHGVRGLALSGVVLFHLFGSGRISGGIDVFLAISGFLFTGMLLREAAVSGGSIDLYKYFGRLIRRIFLPAALVAVTTLIVALTVLPVTSHRQLWAEARATLLYFENYELISSQLAYGAAGPDTSPFQHFWSLSVQGQFYLIWPIVTIIAVLIAKRIKRSAAGVMAVLAVLIVIVSLVHAIQIGSYNQAEAYLMSTTRAWQLALGALIAIGGSAIKLPKPLRMPAGWIGLALIVSCGFVLDGAQLFPGPWALWPVGGLALILLSTNDTAGTAPGSAHRFLSNKPLAWIGDHAYGLYLWHWPLVIFYMDIRGRDAIGFRGAVVILAVTVILAMIMQRFIEQPLTRATKRANTERKSPRNKATVALGIGLIALAGVTTTAFAPQPAALNFSYGGLDAAEYPGAAQYFLDESAEDIDFFPSLEDAVDYRPEYTKKGCSQKLGQDPGTDEVVVCEDENAPERPRATVVLAGGSHAGHLEAAFKNLGQKYDWEVLIVTKSSCVFGWEERDDQEMCGRWNENFIAWLGEREVDLVVTPATRLSQPEHILDAAPMWWDRISETGTDLLLVRGMPRAAKSIPECLAEGGTTQECGPSKENYAAINPLHTIDLPTNVHPIDVTRFVCPAINDSSVPNCDAVVGNILVWYDAHHFTTPFSHSLAAGFEEEMQQAVPHLLR